MAKYHVRLLESAIRELGKLDKSTGHRVAERIKWLSANLDKIHLERLVADLAGFYKLRVGDYRVIYEVIWDERTIIVHAIGHRSKIYRKRR